MKYLFIILLVFLISPMKAQSLSCPCEATTDISRQARTKAKHETNYKNYALKKDTINVKYIYKWQKRYHDLTKTITIKASKPSSLRKHGTSEDSLYILKGYLWFVKMEDNDCDFHMEIGTKNSYDTRIIIEATQENKLLQKKIENELQKRNLHILGCHYSNKAKAHFKKGIPVIVKGLGFYDASHKPDTNHGDKHTQKYSWELHPVQDIIFLN
jgi:hypothetical protein